jgi:hypothetical membrane protein
MKVGRIVNKETLRARAAHRTKTFNARYDWMGPVIATLSAWYLLAQVVVGWVFNPPLGSHPRGPEYSFVKNTISDLGNTACGQYGGSQVCSPRYILMDLSFALLGVAMAVGSLLVYREFTYSALRRERAFALVGFVLLTIAGVGAVLVGSFPENTNGALHATGAGMAIGAANLGILLLGFALVSLPEGLRHFMLASAALSLVAAISFGMKHHFGLGAGGIERIAAYPECVWLIMFGIYITRDHYARGLTKRLRWTAPSASPVAVTRPGLSVRSIRPLDAVPR